MLRQKRPVPQEVEPDPGLQLGPDRSFLDVISEACARSERCTLVAVSEGRTFTALVDRAGPCRISGAGLSGVEALTATASIHTGTYTVIDGWTVMQPQYQPGLNAAFRSITGSGADGGGALPRARGVNAIQDAIRLAGVGPNRFEPLGEPGAFPPVPFDAAALAALHPVATAALPAVAFPPVPAAEPEQPPPPQQPEPEPMQPAIEVAGREPEAPLAAPVVPPVAASVEAPPAPRVEPPPLEPDRDPGLHARAVPQVVEPPSHPPVALGRDLVDYLRTAAADAEPVVASSPEAPPQARKAASLLATRFLLWMVYSEGDPDDYTLREASGLVGQELKANASTAVNRVLGGFNRRWQSTREDWRRSGEVAARDRAERARKARSK